MKGFATMVAACAMSLAIAGAASAALRSPQVPVSGGSLQAYLNTNDGGINVLTDQEDAQRWHSTTGQNATFTLKIELAGNAASNTIGIYNALTANTPPDTLMEVFPGPATSGWFAFAAFRTAPDRVTVSLFDNSAAFQGSTTYFGANQNDFSYYLSGPGGTFYTQDYRNPGGLAQALAYMGTGVNSGSWWLCWEDLARNGGADGDFEDAVLFLQAVNPTPVVHTTWGQLKARFRN